MARWHVVSRATPGSTAELFVLSSERDRTIAVLTIPDFFGIQASSGSGKELGNKRCDGAVERSRCRLPAWPILEHAQTGLVEGSAHRLFVVFAIAALSRFARRPRDAIRLAGIIFGRLYFSEGL